MLMIILRICVRILTTSCIYECNGTGSCSREFPGFGQELIMQTKAGVIVSSDKAAQCLDVLRNVGLNRDVTFATYKK